MGKLFTENTSDSIMSGSNTGITGSQNRTGICWVQQDIGTGGSAQKTILEIGENGAKNRWTFNQPINIEEIRHEIEGSGYTTALATVQDTWHLDVVQFNGTTLADHDIHLDTSKESATGAATLNTTNSPFRVGNSVNQDLLVRAWAGKMFDVCLWDTNLSDIEIDAISRGVPAFLFEHENIVINYQLYGVNGSTEHDISGNENNGTVTGT